MWKRPYANSIVNGYPVQWRMHASIFLNELVEGASISNDSSRLITVSLHQNKGYNNLFSTLLQSGQAILSTTLIGLPKTEVLGYDTLFSHTSLRSRYIKPYAMLRLNLVSIKNVLTFEFYWFPIFKLVVVTLLSDIKIGMTTDRTKMYLYSCVNTVECELCE